MVGTSKILTVSYGTFSCTLEGFDDSFNTMKAIAEYFRGLAADDRYFGAEPPTPDAEMLAKIAEREISRRVDARMEEDGIVLRAAALTDQSGVAGQKVEAGAAQTAAAEAAVSQAAVSQAASASADDAAARAAQTAAQATTLAAKAKAEAEARARKRAQEAARAKEEEAARKAEEEALKKAEAEAEATQAPDTATPPAQDVAAQDVATKDENVEDEAPMADTAASTPATTDIEESEAPALAAATEGTTGSETEETRDTAASSVLAADDPAPTQAPAHPDADSVAAKLQRIRAVVGKEGTPADTDLTEQFLPKTDTPDVADLDTDPLADLEAHQAELAAENNGRDATQADEAAETASDTGAPDMIARVLASQAAAQAAPSGDARPSASAPSDAPADVETEAAADPAADATSDDAGQGDAKTVRPRARVVRVKKADLAAIKQAQASPKAEAEAKSPAPTGPNLGLLDGADDLDEYLEDSDFTESDLDGLDMLEDDLADDLNAIAAETAPEETVPEQAAAAQTEADEPAVSSEEAEATAEDQSDDAAAPATDAPSRFLSAAADVDDAALDRLMSETDAKMQEPEGSRRRDAIAQLKAAVAAKEAARQVGEPMDDGQEVENAFRNDLSQAVQPDGGPRPRPVVRGAVRTERPRPAPLKLVAAQRVDIPQKQERDEPVVPRRVARRSEEAIDQGANSFAEFAEEMGAKELPELLEAAAAYTAFVEGADEFSRPQILRRVRAVASEDFNREDGLRSFANLLRDGRFTKVSNGRFQVADDTRFNPERQAS